MQDSDSSTVAVEQRPLDEIREAVTALGDEVEAMLVGRSAEVRAVITALVAREHCVFLGPPGTAKSMVIDQTVRRISGARYFWIQLFGQTPPTDVFGQVSLQALEDEDVNRRNVEGHLPDAHYAFLDEIFEAQSSILVGCNSIMQERSYMNGNEKVAVPLRAMFAASNVVPEDKGLAALYDRFLLRLVVDPLAEVDDIKAMLQLPEPVADPAPLVSLDELDRAHEAALAVRVPDEVIEAFVEVLTRLRGAEDPVEVSDRRKRKCMRLVQATAWLAGRDEAAIPDLGMIRHALWTRPEERATVDEACASLRTIDTEELEHMMAQLRGTVERARATEDPGDGSFTAFYGSVSQSITQVMDSLKEMGRLVHGDGAAATALADARQQCVQWQREILSRIAGGHTEIFDVFGSPGAAPQDGEGAE